MREQDEIATLHANAMPPMMWYRIGGKSHGQWPPILHQPMKQQRNPLKHSLKRPDPFTCFMVKKEKDKQRFSLCLHDEFFFHDTGYPCKTDTVLLSLRPGPASVAGSNLHAHVWVSGSSPLPSSSSSLPPVVRISYVQDGWYAGRWRVT